jgi:hypothetical protein
MLEIVQTICDATLKIVGAIGVTYAVVSFINLFSSD